MKNADVPAMPIVDDCASPAVCGVGGVEALGLAKREMMAMHMMQGLISAWGQHDVTCFSQLASDAVLAADELLAELDTKCQKS